jgi:hypothetical protein
MSGRSEQAHLLEMQFRLGVPERMTLTIERDPTPLECDDSSSLFCLHRRARVTLAARFAGYEDDKSSQSKG